MGEEQKRQTTRWTKWERILLLLTFVCTAVATVYSVRTASTSLKLASAEMRPWIAVPKMITVPNTDFMRLVLEIQNIGKVPAYFIVEHTSYLDDQAISLNNPNISSPPLALMPQSTFKYTAIKIDGDMYKNIRERGFSRKIKCATRINYGISKQDVGEYFTEFEYTFSPNNFPETLISKEYPGLWPLRRSEFK